MTLPPALESPKLRTLALALAAAIVGFFLVISSPALASGGATYVLFSQGSQSTTMSGSLEELKRARAHRVGGEAMLYARQGRSAYVVRDPETLRRAAAIFEPQHALGTRQGELGSRQAALGHRQAALGAQQARLGAMQAGASPSRQEALGRQQEVLGRRQEELGRQQEALGRQQDALGREQERVSRVAEAQLRALLADAVRRGLARRVD